VHGWGLHHRHYNSTPVKEIHESLTDCAVQMAQTCWCAHIMRYWTFRSNAHIKLKSLLATMAAMQCCAHYRQAILLLLVHCTQPGVLHRLRDRLFQASGHEVLSVRIEDKAPSDFLTPGIGPEACGDCPAQRAGWHNTLPCQPAGRHGGSG
jgi:hypothetical protein